MNMKMLRQLEERVKIANKAGSTPESMPRKARAAYDGDAEEDETPFMQGMIAHIARVSSQKKTEKGTEEEETSSSSSMPSSSMAKAPPTPPLPVKAPPQLKDDKDIKKMSKDELETRIAPQKHP